VLHCARTRGSDSHRLLALRRTQDCIALSSELCELSSASRSALRTEEHGIPCIVLRYPSVLGAQVSTDCAPHVSCARLLYTSTLHITIPTYMYYRKYSV